jgi:hypothetical protein
MLRPHAEGVEKAMSSEDIPYQLRPNKFIDRQLFLDILARAVIARGGPERYLYVSMGGRHLVDHFAVYSRLGIQSYSFDKDQNEVYRQAFNRPTDATRCVLMNSADLPARLDDIVRKSKKKNVIVWLDFTSPAERRVQFQEALATLSRLKDGDVFRITLNADHRSLCKNEEWKKSPSPSPDEFRLAKLKEQIGEYVPTDIVAITKTEIPYVLARCVELMVMTAESERSDVVFHPLLVTGYTDGTEMLTVTCIALSRNEAEGFLRKSEISDWSFRSKTWTEIRRISVPVLSPRERYRLDSMLNKGTPAMLKSLRFFPTTDLFSSLAVVESYRELHRHYPSFRFVED